MTGARCSLLGEVLKFCGLSLPRSLSLSLVLVGLSAVPSFAEDASGRWSGAIDNHLWSLVRIEKAPDGTYTGTYSSHEQPLDKPDAHAVTDAPLTQISATADHLSFEVQAIGGARFEGKWDSGRGQWTGTFQWGRGGYKSFLNLRRTEATTLTAALADARKPRVYSSPAEESNVMEGLIDAYVRDDRFTGAILVTRKGRVLVDKGYGPADRSVGTLNTPDTRYHIASITKPFTATAILMLQDRGQLSIDDPLTKYIPDAPTAWQGITLRHLLAHTSGLGDHNPLLTGHFGEAFTPARLWGIIRTLPLDSQPGEKYQYSNAGYSILGLVIEKVSGQAYGDFLRANIFVPLHMDATAYNPPVGPKDAIGYEMGEDAPVAAAHRDLTSSFSAGGLVSTTHDLLKWQEALFGGRLISKAALAEMQGQGLGMARTTVDEHTLYSHSGHLPGYVSDAAYQPEDGLSVIVLGNLDNSSAVWISKALTTIAHGVPAEVVPLPKAIEVVPEILAQYVGTYVLMPDLSLTVTVEGNHLAVQATGQDKVRAYPESETMFFAKTVEAKLEFVRDKDGKISCILHQAGQHIPGVRQ